MIVFIEPIYNGCGLSRSMQTHIANNCHVLRCAVPISDRLKKKTFKADE